MPNTNAIDIDDLYYSAIDAQSTYFNFGAGYSETWEDVPMPYLFCPSGDFFGQEGLSYEEGDACPRCDSHLERPEVSPMMNYYYELPNYDGDPEADQVRLYQSSANVVLVKIIGGEDTDDAYALALSGGGMDLSWDICHAYILLGYAPPIRFCNLPEFAGQDNTREPFWTVLKACLQSVKAMAQRASTRKAELIRQVEMALACSKCGHPDTHNRVGGCARFGLVKGWEGDQCPCLEYPENRPSDSEVVRRG